MPSVAATPRTRISRRAAGAFEGDDPILHWIDEIRETWIEVHWHPERIFEAGEVVVSFYRTVSVGRESGVEVKRDLTGVYRIREGRIASEHVFLDRAEALEAAGLSE